MNPHIMVNITCDNHNQIIHIFQGLYFTSKGYTSQSWKNKDIQAVTPLVQY